MSSAVLELHVSPLKSTNFKGDNRSYTGIQYNKDHYRKSVSSKNRSENFAYNHTNGSSAGAGKVCARKKLRRHVVSFISFCLFVIASSYFYFSLDVPGSVSEAVNIGHSQNYSAQFTSVLVQPGDTLTSIAEKYITPQYSSVDDYVSYIKELNHLSGDTIYAGSHLLINR